MSLFRCLTLYPITGQNQDTGKSVSQSLYLDFEGGCRTELQVRGSQRSRLGGWDRAIGNWGDFRNRSAKMWERRGAPGE